MPTICVELDESDIYKACEYWATHRVLNEGDPISSELSATACNGKPSGAISSCRVWVRTQRMPAPSGKGE